MSDRPTRILQIKLVPIESTSDPEALRQVEQQIRSVLVKCTTDEHDGGETPAAVGAVPIDAQRDRKLQRQLVPVLQADLEQHTARLRAFDLSARERLSPIQYTERRRRLIAKSSTALRRLVAKGFALAKRPFDVVAEDVRAVDAATDQTGREIAVWRFVAKVVIRLLERVGVGKS